MRNTLLRLALPVALAIFAGAPGYAMHRQPQEEEGLRRSPDAPPRARRETRSARPGRNHMWIGGCWEEPSRKGSTWIKPRYHHAKDGYRYEAGRWSK